LKQWLFVTVVIYSVLMTNLSVYSLKQCVTLHRNSALVGPKTGEGAWHHNPTSLTFTLYTLTVHCRNSTVTSKCYQHDRQRKTSASLDKNKY